MGHGASSPPSEAMSIDMPVGADQTPPYLQSSSTDVGFWPSHQATPNSQVAGSTRLHTKASIPGYSVSLSSTHSHSSHSPDKKAVKIKETRTITLGEMPSAKRQKRSTTINTDQQRAISPLLTADNLKLLQSPHDVPHSTSYSHVSGVELAENHPPMNNDFVLSHFPHATMSEIASMLDPQELSMEKYVDYSPCPSLVSPYEVTQTIASSRPEGSTSGSHSEDKQIGTKQPPTRRSDECRTGRNHQDQKPEGPLSNVGRGSCDDLREQEDDPIGSNAVDEHTRIGA